MKIIVQRNFRKMRHVHRTHRVNFAWIVDYLVQSSPPLQLYHVPTYFQLADIFTKPFETVLKWKHACAMIGLFHDDNPLQQVEYYQSLVACGTAPSVIDVAAPCVMSIQLEPLSTGQLGKVLEPDLCDKMAQQEPPDTAGQTQPAAGSWQAWAEQQRMMQQVSRAQHQPGTSHVAAAALPLLSSVPMLGAQQLTQTAAGGKPLPAALEQVVEAGGKPPPTTQLLFTAAGGNPLPTVTEQEEVAHITTSAPALPPLVMP